MVVWAVVAAAVGYMVWKVVKSNKKSGTPVDGLATRNQKKPTKKQN